MDDPIDRSLGAADRGEVGGTYREQRREFQQPGIGRPDDRPMAGSTIIERMRARFMPRSQDRDMARQSSGR